MPKYVNCANVYIINIICIFGAKMNLQIVVQILYCAQYVSIFHAACYSAVIF